MTPPGPRPIVEADLDAIVALERRIFTDPWSRRAFAASLARAAVRGWLIETRPGTVAAYGIASMAADEGEILNLAVAPEARGQGCGRAITDAMLAWMAALGARRVYLEVRQSNAAAIGLYTHLGFQAVGSRKAYYERPTEDAITMARDLPRNRA